MKKELPPIIQEVGFDFSWDERKVWALDYPTEVMPTSELAWHLDVPFLWTKPAGYYDLKPSEVLARPQQYPDEYERTLQADMSYPIDIMQKAEHWVILDGLHRLMKATLEKQASVSVRKIPREAIPLIKKDK